jgi:hypothetical protein
MEVICDASELTAVFGAQAPNTFVLAGYSIANDHVPRLIKRAGEIKEAAFGDKNVPIKWNVKDLDRALKLHGLSDLSPKIKEKSNLVRGELLTALSDSGATLFLSVLLAYSNDRQVLGESKDDLVRYSFSNFLMRVGLFCKEHNGGDVQVILDWPDKDQRQIFVEEYLSGWRDGKSYSADQSVDYRCGPLTSIGFREAPVFGVTDLDVRLQFADLLVGACRSFINFSMGCVPKEHFGVQQFKAIAPCLDRADGWRCFGRGITVAPANSAFSRSVLTTFNALGC